MPCRHIDAASERLDVERLGVLAIDSVADSAEQGEIA
jgi:hypothetical protein